MAAPLIASLPLDLVLSSGYVVRVVALVPTTGAAVTGVRVTDLAFQVRPFNTVQGGGTTEEAPMPLLVPTEDQG